ncbi:MAG: bifunctional 3-deoxy-7-phosphoheptulonate synthase/chorismate mutase type II [Bacteroidia bacterium]|nr:bifunctional 3-deoxy-7-phosphoheptulonate synthase/chorismate mutase type II [Bacteroidia bacterium]
MNNGINFLPLSQWGFNFSHPLIIAGPCSVETPEQVKQTGLQLKLQGVKMLRGGIWKPRTRPDTFQGIGSEGLKWLKDAAVEAGIPACVEVASPQHAEDALTAGIDVLWLGARTTVNPFLVQQIADALSGIDIPVLIKNPINPELELWLGAIERIQRAGIKRIAAIHRGFSTFEKTIYRNPPNWEIPIELRRRIPELPILCDPSHICGKREMISSVCQTALDLSYDGLMIEAHVNPSQAWSDSEQQLTPVQLGELLSTLVLRKITVDDVVFNSLLEKLRHKIDVIDADILGMMAERMNVAKEIGQYKKEHNMTILQVKRWKEILRTRTKLGVEHELTPEFVAKMYELIHSESIHHQTQVMNKKEISNEA